MKLKIIIILLLAVFTFAFAYTPRVHAEGEITTTQAETLTTTQSALGTEIDYQLERVKTMIASGVTAIGGVGAVGGVVSIFIKKKREQIDASIATAKKGYDDASAKADALLNQTSAKVAEIQKSADGFQTNLTAKIDASMAKLDATAAKVEAMEKAYQEREARMAALLKAELEQVKTDGAALADKAAAISGGIIGS